MPVEVAVQVLVVDRDPERPEGLVGLVQKQGLLDLHRLGGRMDWASSTLVEDIRGVAGTGAYIEVAGSQRKTSAACSLLGEDHGGILEGFQCSQSALGDRKLVETSGMGWDVVLDSPSFYTCILFYFLDHFSRCHQLRSHFILFSKSFDAVVDNGGEAPKIM